MSDYLKELFIDQVKNLGKGSSGGASGIPIVDISDKVVNSQFDFISAGEGLYYSSKEIEFNFLAWDENYENYKEVVTTRKGLFSVSVNNQNNILRVITHSYFSIYDIWLGEQTKPGFYDECIDCNFTTLTMNDV